MNAFHFNKNGKPRPNESGRSGDMEETRHVANIFFIILDEYLSITQQVIALFKAVLHHSLVEHVKSAGLIFLNKEIKVAVLNHTNKKSIIKEAIRKKRAKEE